MEQCRENETSSGVNFESPLLQLKDFDIFSQVPFDIMHTCLEGVIPLTLKLVVSDLISKGVQSDDLFQSINLFPFEFHFKSNVSSKITTLSDFHQTAMQNYTLFFVTVFSLGSFSLPDSSSFNLLIFLSDVLSILFSPIPLNCVAITTVQNRILLFIEHFSEGFPDKFTPKMHF